MQSNDLLHSSTSSPFVRSPHLLPNDLQSQLNMLYALTQQQISSSSPSDLTFESQIKRIKYVCIYFYLISNNFFFYFIEKQCQCRMNLHLKYH